jgi:hypothetical protein
MNFISSTIHVNPRLPIYYIVFASAVCVVVSLHVLGTFSFFPRLILKALNHSQWFFLHFQLEDFKVAQKEQQQQIEKEISSRERDINCLKHYRSRCADIVS